MYRTIMVLVCTYLVPPYGYRTVSYCDDVVLLLTCTRTRTRTRKFCWFGLSFCPNFSTHPPFFVASTLLFYERTVVCFSFTIFRSFLSIIDCVVIHSIRYRIVLVYFCLICSLLHNIIDPPPSPKKERTLLHHITSYHTVRVSYLITSHHNITSHNITQDNPSKISIQFNTVRVD